MDGMSIDDIPFDFCSQHTTLFLSPKSYLSSMADLDHIDMDKYHTAVVDHLPYRIIDRIFSSVSILDREKSEWTQGLLCCIAIGGGAPILSPSYF
jgi:hypothetical protein